MNTLRTSPQFRQPNVDAVQSVNLNSGEHRWLTRSMQVVRVISGTAWITSSQADYVVGEGGAVVLQPTQYRPLIGTLNSQPITFESQRLQPGSTQEGSATDELNDPRLLLDQSWPWLTRLDGGCRISTEYSDDWTLAELTISTNGTVVHLTDYGWVRVFRTDNARGQAEFWATSKLDISVEEAAFRMLNGAA
jgi:hypothetical protein